MLHLTCPGCGNDHCNLDTDGMAIVLVEGVGAWLRFWCPDDEMPTLRPLVGRQVELVAAAHVPIEHLAAPRPSARPATTFPIGDDEVIDLALRFKALTSADLEELTQ